MNTFTLKIIACISMLIDHLTQKFIPENVGVLFKLTFGDYSEVIDLNFIGHAIGRLAFPIFAFLLVEGFFHTKSLKKYLVRLGILALISEIAYDYYAWGFPDTTFLFVKQNVVFTLFLGLVTIALIDQIHKTYQMQPVFMNIFMALVIVAGAMTQIFIHSDYYDYGYGVLLIVLFYFFHNQKLKMTIAYILLVGFLQGGVGFMAVLAAPFLYNYNGQLGRKAKYLFYIFYPTHLVLIQLIYTLTVQG